MGLPRIASLHRYPVKSLGGESPARLAVDQFGPAWDRRWMVTDLDGAYLTQREEPRLALAAARIADDRLEIETEALETLRVPLAPDRGRRLRVSVWADSCDAVAVDGPATEWFSEHLERRCQLVFMETARPVSPEFGRDGDVTSFTDGYPFLVIGQGSLDDLNGRLDETLPMNRFRPNLVVDGIPAFDEDEWSRIRAGEMVLRVVKPCPRCVVTTTDQATGERGREPLRTLATYRIRDGQVMFGMNAIHDGPGVLEAGAEIDVLERREATR